MDQIIRQSGQPFVLILAEAIFDRDVPALNETCILQALKGCGH
jgi:hypothetical protein